MQRFAWMCGAALFAFTALACQQAETDRAGAGAAARADTSGHDDAAGQAAGAEEEEPLSTRAEETARDAGEKPQEVMDELGVEQGGRVLDVIAGGGYYTYLLSDRVGPGGLVYATGAKGVARRLQEGDLSGRTNIKVVEELSEVPPGSLDAVLINRAYHLINNPQESFFPGLQAALKPGGTVGVIEVRLGAPTGHDMKTHRMGEQTVREELEQGGFTFAGESDILANPDDPRTDFMEGKRHLADRMFLTFKKPEETAQAR